MARRKEVTFLKQSKWGTRPDLGAILLVAAIVLATLMVGFHFGTKYGEAKSAGVSIGRLHIDNFSVNSGFGENNFTKIFLDDLVLENVIVALGGLER